MDTFIKLTLSLVFATSVMAGVPDAAADAEPLQTGVQVPNPEVRTLEGKVVPLDTVRNGDPVVLVFYRGGWCPFCMRHLSALQEVKEDLHGLGWRIVGVSPDKPENLRGAMEKADVAYDLVSDSDMAAARAFGVAFEVGTEERKNLKSHGIDLESASGKTHHQLPVPSVFAIDAAGEIQFVYSNPDYKTRLSGEALLKAVH